MDLKTIDLSTLTEVETMQLYQFWYAYNREYPEAMTWREYRADGFQPVEWTSVGMDEIEESFDELIQYHIDEDGFVKPLPAGDRANWKDRLINKWTRRDEWTL